MRDYPQFNRQIAFLAAWIIVTYATGHLPEARGQGSAAPENSTSSPKSKPEVKPELDRTGHKRVGEASFYADKFAGRKMADGAVMDPQGDNAASKTLPLGTKAKVTNLETGNSAVVTIEDRGPYVEGRIVDLSPLTARKIGIARDKGVAKVEVVPIAVPLSDGTVKAGDAVEGSKGRSPSSGDRGK
jgi:rare lipoprotein A